MVITHTTFYAQERAGSSDGVWRFGEIGVPIFFVISGLVMTLSTENLSTDTTGARIFLLRRFIRIVPLYWLATGAKVIVALAVPIVVNHNHFNLEHAIKSFLFIPYFNEAGDLRPMHGVGWTLFHEVYFYLLFAACLAAGRRPFLHVSFVICASWLIGMYLPDKSAFIKVVTSESNLNFVVGMATGWLLLRNERRAAHVILGGALAALVVGLIIGSGVALVIIFATSVLLLSHRRFPMWWRPVVALGDSSYSLYLFHPFIAPALTVLIGKHLLHFPTFSIALICAITILVSHLLHLVVEKPVVRRARGFLTPTG